MIRLRNATLEEREKTYKWLFLSDVTYRHIGPPLYPELSIPTWEEFLEEFVDFNFTPEGRSKASVMVIENEEEELGNVCYSCFHVYEGVAEVDIWLKSERVCGKGYGSQALREMIEYLKKEMKIHTFIIRPSVRNIPALKTYKKVGFRHVDDKEQAVKKYIREEYINIYGAGDYGMDESTFMELKVSL